MIDIKAIKAAAEAATPGPWIEAGPSYGEPKPRFYNSVVTEEDEDGDWLDICCSTSDNTDADMTHIATANPTAVIALCDEVERLRDKLAQADDDSSAGMMVVRLQVADQMRRKYEPVLREVLDLLGPEAPECCGCRAEWEMAIDAIRKVLG